MAGLDPRPVAGQGFWREPPFSPIGSRNCSPRTFLTLDPLFQSLKATALEGVWREPPFSPIRPKGSKFNNLLSVASLSTYLFGIHFPTLLQKFHNVLFQMSERSDDREWSMRISNMFADGDYDSLAAEFGWNDADDDEDEDL